MSYRVKTETFEGPFDLLLHLVARQKLDIGSISIGDVTDQYLAYIERMKDFDLDVASDFMLVASQLLEIKAASLLPTDDERETLSDEFDDLTPDEAREILIGRLIAYKQFKSAALSLGTRAENTDRMHPRHAGIESEFLGLMPDYLSGITLHGLAVICADIMSRRDTFLLEAEHIAAMPIPVELHVEQLRRELRTHGKMTFTELVGDDNQPAIVVVTFLAILELYKRRIIDITQECNFGEIDVKYRAENDDPEKPITLDDDFDADDSDADDSDAQDDGEKPEDAAGTDAQDGDADGVSDAAETDAQDDDPDMTDDEGAN